MPIIDIHAHITPRRFADAIERDGQWHTLGPDVGELHIPKFRISAEEHVADLDRLEVDVHVITANTGFWQYGLDAQVTLAISRECNDVLRERVAEYPDRFCALASLPMQDVPLAISEMEHWMTVPGFKGVSVGDHINGHEWDEAQFRPFWKAVEELGAVVFFHQSSSTVVEYRTERYGLPNTVGNLTERALTFGALVFGGVMDEFPNLKLCLGHAGGYVAFGIARMDKGWRAGALPVMPEFEDARSHLQRAPSEYLRSFYYDCCTHSEATLRFLLDTVGADRVVLGTDWPCPMDLDDAVPWIRSLESLTADEKEAILAKTATQLLGL
jgi:aminocarboxymuconate-semialdehyde decarboxylase